ITGGVFGPSGVIVTVPDLPFPSPRADVWIKVVTPFSLLLIATVPPFLRVTTTVPLALVTQVSPGSKWISMRYGNWGFATVDPVPDTADPFASVPAFVGGVVPTSAVANFFSVAPVGGGVLGAREVFGASVGLGEEIGGGEFREGLEALASPVL